MAKRKRKEEESDVPFKFPEFDRRGFILKEMTQAKILFAITGLALIFGIVAFLLTLQLNNTIIGLLAGIAGFFPIKGIAEKVADTSVLEKKDWFGHYAIYFLTFLAVWVLLFNYPITDVSHPEITGITVYVMHYNNTANSSVEEWLPAENSTVQAGSNISVRADITDNGRLASASIIIKDNSGTIDGAMVRTGGTHTFHFEPDEPLNPGSYSFTITASDEAGNSFSTEPEQLLIR